MVPDHVAELRRSAPYVISEPEQLGVRVRWADVAPALPSLVALPGSAEDVQAVVRACAREGIPFVARGAGTGLSGGATPVAGGIVISLARMNRILEIDLASERIVVEPGVTNLDVTRAVEADGYFFAPDPSSQQVCTIGGNVAENSGGAHCLKNGFTANHVTGLDVVLPDGELVTLGGKRFTRRARPARACRLEGTPIVSASRPHPAGLRRPLLAGFHSTDAAGAVSA